MTNLKVAARAASERTRGFLVYVLSDHSIILRIETAPQDGGVVRLHVKEGYFFTSPKQVTSPTWGPPPLC